MKRVNLKNKISFKALSKSINQVILSSFKLIQNMKKKHNIICLK